MSKPIRVVIDTYSLASSYSGIGTYINELIASLSALNSEVELVILPELSNHRRVKKNLSLFQKILEHVKFYFWKSFELPKKVKELSPCVLIVPDFVLPPQKLVGVRKFAVIHDDLFWKFPENYNSIWRRWFIRLIKKGLKGDSQIITTSEYSKTELGKLFDNKINVVYQSYNSFASSQTDILKRYELSKKGYLLHVGTFDKRKNLITLVRAVERLKKEKVFQSLKCVLVGEQRPNNHSEVLDELNTYIVENQLHNDIIFTGYLSKNDLGQLYTNTFCYVFPSLYEGFGIPILEAFSVGIPVITSDSEALVEVGREATLKFPRQDDQALANTIVKLWKDEILVDDLTMKGKERIKDFSGANFGRSILDVIQK